MKVVTVGVVATRSAWRRSSMQAAVRSFQTSLSGGSDGGMKIPSKTVRTSVAPPANVLNVEELCDYLQISPVTVYRMLKRRNLPGFRILGNWRFNIEDVDRWMKEGAGSARQSNERKKLTQVENALTDRPGHEEELRAKRQLLASEMGRYIAKLSVELREKWEKVSARLGREVAALDLGIVLAPEIADKAIARPGSSAEPRRKSDASEDANEKLLNRELMVLDSLNRSIEALGHRLDELQGK
jgi:excisionase family DNA binding protein